MRILYVGDILAHSGVDYLINNLKKIKNDYKPNLIFVNAENCAYNGKGIDFESYQKLITNNINAITMGNHTFDNNDIYKIFENKNHIITIPCNYDIDFEPKYKLINYNNKKILLINVLGRLYVNYYLKSPFSTVEKIIEENKADYIVIDFHAESASEKLAFANYFDGKVNAVVGTHTHVPTADFRVLPKGTLYITDIGMTGPYDGIVGYSLDSIEMFITGLRNKRNQVAKGKMQLNCVLLDLTLNKIESINIHD